MTRLLSIVLIALWLLWFAACAMFSFAAPSEVRQPSKARSAQFSLVMQLATSKSRS